MSSSFTLSQLNNSQMTDWQYITTVGGHVQMTPTFIRDVGSIIDTLITTGRVKQLKDLIDLLFMHVENREELPHGFGVEYFKNELIAQLFKGYRLLGYTGDLTDMWMRLFTHIETATLVDAVHNHEDTKAVSAPKFKVMFDAHERSLNSHFGALAEFMPKGIYAEPPTISLRDDHMEDPYYDNIRQEDGSYLYQVQSNETSASLGTVVLEFTYTEISDVTPLMTFNLSDSRSIAIEITTDTLIGKVITTGGVEDIIFTYPLSLTELGSRKFLFGYNSTEIVIRGSDQAKVYLPSFLTTDNVTINSIHIHNFTRYSSPAWTRGLTYYPAFIDADDALVFLVN